MVERLTAALVDGGISTVTLYAEPGVVGLYEKLGFVRDPQGVKGLAFQSKSAPGRALVGR
jgi:aralkylamine N-acetyltransferase